MTSVLYTIQGGNIGQANGTAYCLVSLTSPIDTAVAIGGYMIPYYGNDIPSATWDAYYDTWAAGVDGSAPDGGTGSFIHSCTFPFLGSVRQLIEGTMNVSLLFGGVPDNTQTLAILWAQLP